MFLLLLESYLVCELWLASLCFRMKKVFQFYALQRKLHYPKVLKRRDVSAKQSYNFIHTLLQKIHEILFLLPCNFNSRQKDKQSLI